VIIEVKQRGWFKVESWKAKVVNEGGALGFKQRANEGWGSKRALVSTPEDSCWSGLVFYFNKVHKKERKEAVVS
jgi:hypothetical protein